jgi:plasmid stabilization system protein ParE
MKLRCSRRALADLDRIAARIAAATEFAAELHARVALLQSFPLLGRAGVYDDARELVVHGNYLVTYRVRADEVQVLQLWHVARNLPRGGGP